MNLVKIRFPSLFALTSEAVYGGLLSVCDPGTIQEGSVRDLCSLAPDFMKTSDNDDGPDQGRVILWGSQIISTRSRKEPLPQLDG